MSASLLLAAASALFFDDFSQPDVAALQRAGWRVRTAPGHPGVPGAHWGRPDGVRLVDDPAQPGNRLLQLQARTDGTPAGTEQAQVCGPRKFLRGTYAARVKFSDQPSAGAGGDPVVQSFYAVAPLRFDFDPEFSEVDFEYLPQGGWGSPRRRLYAISWQTARVEPWSAHNAAHEEMDVPGGWHELVIQVEAARTRHFLDGRLIHEATGRNVPVVPMAIQANLWFSPGGLGAPSAVAREWVQQFDWVLHVPEAALAPEAVRAEVARLRAAGVVRTDTVTAPALPAECNV